MKRSRLEILIVVISVLALSAGVVAGLLASRLPVSTNPLPVPPPGGMERSLAEELNLSEEQRTKMRGIWETVHGDVNRTFEDAIKLEQQRDEALVAILTDEQKAQFEKISKDFAGRFDGLSRQRDQIFGKAVEDTRKVLDETQKQKYEQILKTHVRPPMVPRGRTFLSPATREPATRPAT
jgi:Spy/CpxP family protein refolding chaperone